MNCAAQQTFKENKNCSFIIILDCYVQLRHFCPESLLGVHEGQINSTGLRQYLCLCHEYCPYSGKNNRSMKGGNIYQRRLM